MLPVIPKRVRSNTRITGTFYCRIFLSHFSPLKFFSFFLFIHLLLLRSVFFYFSINFFFLSFSFYFFMLGGLGLFWKAGNKNNVSSWKDLFSHTVYICSCSTHFTFSHGILFFFFHTYIHISLSIVSLSKNFKLAHFI